MWITTICIACTFYNISTNGGVHFESFSSQTRLYRDIAAAYVSHVIPRDHQNEAGRVLLELGELSHFPAGFVQDVLVVCVQLEVHTCLSLIHI